jgi:hypothetical protein
MFTVRIPLFRISLYRPQILIPKYFSMYMEKLWFFNLNAFFTCSMKAADIWLLVYCACKNTYEEFGSKTLFLFIQEKCSQSLKFTGKCIRSILDFGS